MYNVYQHVYILVLISNIFLRSIECLSKDSFATKKTILWMEEILHHLFTAKEERSLSVDTSLSSWGRCILLQRLARYAYHSPAGVQKQDRYGKR